MSLCLYVYTIPVRLFIKSHLNNLTLQTPNLSPHRRWNQLDILIVLLSVAGIVLEELKTLHLPINPTIIRVMRVLRIARGN